MGYWYCIGLTKTALTLTVWVASFVTGLTLRRKNTVPFGKAGVLIDPSLCSSHHLSVVQFKTSLIRNLCRDFGEQMGGEIRVSTRTHKMQLHLSPIDVYTVNFGCCSEICIGLCAMTYRCQGHDSSSSSNAVRPFQL
jgi:hypothetical protein